MDNEKLLLEDTTDEIINAFYLVYNELGFGFLEKVYQNSLFLELLSRGFKVEPQKQIKVYFKGRQVGEYYADMVVEDLVILELKTSGGIELEHEAQLLNYLKGTEMEVGLLLNFGFKTSNQKKNIYKRPKKSLNKWADGH